MPEFCGLFVEPKDASHIWQLTAPDWLEFESDQIAVIIISAETAAQAKDRSKTKPKPENDTAVRNKKEQQPSEEQTDDDLMETVIIKPKKPST